MKIFLRSNLYNFFQIYRTINASLSKPLYAEIFFRKICAIVFFVELCFRLWFRNLNWVNFDFLSLFVTSDFVWLVPVGSFIFYSAKIFMVFSLSYRSLIHFVELKSLRFVDFISTFESSKITVTEADFITVIQCMNWTKFSQGVGVVLGSGITAAVVTDNMYLRSQAQTSEYNRGLAVGENKVLREQLEKQAEEIKKLSKKSNSWPW